MHATHLVPFMAAIAAGVECVMTSHPLYPNLDPSGVPATFSRLIVEEYLRGQLGYRGVIVSDDLEMGAISEFCPIGEATVRAAAAGHDLLLVCHKEAAQRGRGHGPRRCVPIARAAPRLPRSGRRARAPAPRQRTRTRTEGGPPRPEPDGRRACDGHRHPRRHRGSPGRPGVKRALNGRVVVVFPRFSDLAPRITIEPALAAERAWVGDAFAPAGVAPETVLVGIEPTPEEIAAAAEQRRRAPTPPCSFSSTPISIRATEPCSTRCKRAPAALAVVLLRDPYDARLLAPATLGLTAYGFRKCQLDAVVARLAYP